MNRIKLLFISTVCLAVMLICSVGEITAYAYCLNPEYIIKELDNTGEYEYLKAIRICSNREYELELGDVNVRQYNKGDFDIFDINTRVVLKDVKCDSKELKIRYKKGKKILYPVAYVQSNKEGTYKLTWTAELSYTDKDDKDKMVTRTATFDTIVYVYDYNVDYDEYSNGAGFEDIYYQHNLKLYMNGKELQYRKTRYYNRVYDSKVKRGKLTASIDAKGITVLKIKIYGDKLKGGRKTTIENIKKGKKVYLNSKVPKNYIIGKWNRTVVRVIYREDYTGYVYSERIFIETPKK